MWKTTNMRKKNPRFNRFAPIVCGVLGVPPHTSGFLIVNIQHVEYLQFAIGAPPTFFRADSVPLNTPHTTWISDKIIFRTTKIIRTLPRIVGRGEIGPKSARLSCGVYPALDPPWVSCHQSATVSTPVQGKTRMSPIRWLRCFVVGCNNEYSSHHLPLTSEPLKTQRINGTFILKWMRRFLIYLNASMFARIIRDPASTYRRSEYKGFYESLQIAFPNNVLVSQFRG